MIFGMDWFGVLTTVSYLIVFIPAIKLFSLYVRKLHIDNQLGLYATVVIISFTGPVAWIISTVMLIIYGVYYLLTLLAKAGEDNE